MQYKICKARAIEESNRNMLRKRNYFTCRKHEAVLLELEKLDKRIENAMRDLIKNS